jgi:hypothetical protein
MKKLIAIILLISMWANISLALWPYQQKPMLGRQVNKDHPLGDPIAVWLFNEGSGNKVFDLSGNGNTVNFFNDTHFVAGKFGPAIDFDGSDYAIGTKAALLNIGSGDPITIIAWIDSDAPTETERIVTNEEAGGNNNINWAMLIGNTDLVFRYRNANNNQHHIWETSGNIMASGWTQLAITYTGADGSSIKGYKDGVEYAGGWTTGDGNDPPRQRSSTYLHIGGRVSFNQRYFDGRVDNIAVYKRILSASEVALFYSQPFCFMQGDMDVSQMYDYAVGVVPTLYYRFAACVPLFIICGLSLVMRGSK